MLTHKLNFIIIYIRAEGQRRWMGKATWSTWNSTFSPWCVVTHRPRAQQCAKHDPLICFASTFCCTHQLPCHTMMWDGECEFSCCPQLLLLLLPLCGKNRASICTHRCALTLCSVVAITTALPVQWSRVYYRPGCAGFIYLFACTKVNSKLLNHIDFSHGDLLLSHELA